MSYYTEPGTYTMDLSQSVEM